MKPEIWGPHLWYVMHLMSFTYPDNPTYSDKRVYHDFFTNFRHLLPCDFCRKHYARHIANYPITPHLDSKYDLIRWVINVHNTVNLSLNKPPMTVEEVIDLYQLNGYQFPNYKPKNRSTMVDNGKYYRLIIFIACLIAGIAYWKWNEYQEYLTMYY